jgi:hypothetical protein
VFAAEKSLLFGGETLQKGCGVFWPRELGGGMPDLFGVASVGRVAEYRSDGAADRIGRSLVVFDDFGNTERSATFGI